MNSQDIERETYSAAALDSAVKASEQLIYSHRPNVTHATPTCFLQVLIRQMLSDLSLCMINAQN